MIVPILYHLFHGFGIETALAMPLAVGTSLSTIVVDTVGKELVVGVRTAVRKRQDGNGMRPRGSDWHLGDILVADARDVERH